MVQRYTAAQLARTLEALRAVFDRVRTVEPVRTVERHLTLPVPPGDVAGELNCYSVWNHRQERCLNCISLRAVQEGERQTKYEFVDQDIFYVVAVPIEVDGQVLALEMVSKVNDHVLLSACGVNEFVDRITAYNAQLHLDAGTGLFNKHYFDEKLFLLCARANLNQTDAAVALLDVDGFEHIARHFGQQVTDEAIIAIGRLLNANVSHRRGDFVARYGTNTFAIVFDNIPRLLLRQRLVDLSQRVTGLRLRGYEDVRLNVSMGVFLLSENRRLSVAEIALTVARRVEVARAAGMNRIAFADR